MEPRDVIILSENLSGWLTSRPSSRLVGRPTVGARYPVWTEPVPASTGEDGAANLVHLT